MANTDTKSYGHADKATAEVTSVADAASTARTEVVRRADDATHVASETLDERPFGTIAGAIAIGAVLAALIPASERELKALGPVGRRMRDAADEALQAARQAGMAELSTSGLTLAAASDGAGGIVGKLVKAATAAANAAMTKPEATATPSAGATAGAAVDRQVTPPMGSAHPAATV